MRVHDHSEQESLMKLSQSIVGTVALVSVAFAGNAFGAVVFNNLTKTSTSIYSVSGSSDVTWFAVYANNSTNQTALDLNQLSVAIYKNAGFTGCTLNAFVAIANGTSLSTAYPTLVASGATAPAYQTLGSVSLAATSTAAASTATFGNGTTTSATIALNNTWSTHGAFFVGFQFVGNSATSTLRAALYRSTGTTAGSATTPTVGAIDNAFWSSTSSVTGAVAGPYGFTTSTTAANVGCLSVSGNLVAIPSPGAAALIGLAGLVARRRR